MAINTKDHITISLVYFLLAALFGVVLRFFGVFEMPVTYKFMVHTHSHIALLGWVYLALTTLIYKLFIQTSITDEKYTYIFWFTQLTLIGMLLTFPFQGYALFSIIFSTLFLLATYWFFWFFESYATREIETRNSYKCIRYALWYLVVSSLGPWALGGIMNTLGPESIWYRMAIYFYLHFQYNGWMVLAMFGILLYIMEQKQITLSKKQFNQFFWSLNLGILLSFFLSTLWVKPHLFYNLIGGSGALAQVLSFAILLIALLKTKISKSFSSFQMKLMKTIAVLVTFKMTLQLLSAFPYFAILASTILDFTIGYLHWTFLGVVSIALSFFLNYFKLMVLTEKIYLLYFTGFILTEILIFYKGLSAWLSLPILEVYFEVLAVISLLIPLALISILRRRTPIKID